MDDTANYGLRGHLMEICLFSNNTGFSRCAAALIGEPSGYYRHSSYCSVSQSYYHHHRTSVVTGGNAGVWA